MFLAVYTKLTYLFWSGLIGTQAFLNEHPVLLNVWSNINKATGSTEKNLKSIAKGLFIVVIILAGILFSFGNRMSQNAKQLLMYALVGVAIVALAASLVPSFANMFGWNAR